MSVPKFQQTLVTSWNQFPKPPFQIQLNINKCTSKQISLAGYGLNNSRGIKSFKSKVMTLHTSRQKMTNTYSWINQSLFKWLISWLVTQSAVHCWTPPLLTHRPLTPLTDWDKRWESIKKNLIQSTMSGLLDVACVCLVKNSFIIIFLPVHVWWLPCPFILFNSLSQKNKQKKNALLNQSPSQTFVLIWCSSGWWLNVNDFSGSCCSIGSFGSH